MFLAALRRINNVRYLYLYSNQNITLGWCVYIICQAPPAPAWFRAFQSNRGIMGSFHRWGDLGMLLTALRWWGCLKGLKHSFTLHSAKRGEGKRGREGAEKPGIWVIMQRNKNSSLLPPALPGGENEVRCSCSTQGAHFQVLISSVYYSAIW